MEIKEITVSFGRTITDNNYGSYRSSVSITADVNENFDEAKESLMSECEIAVLEGMLKLKENGI